MSSHEPTQAFGIRQTLTLERWKVAIAIGTAVLLAPVIALVLFLVLATMLPVLPLFAMVFAGFWLRGPYGPPSEFPRSPRWMTRRISSLPSPLTDS